MSLCHRVAAVIVHYALVFCSLLSQDQWTPRCIKNVHYQQNSAVVFEQHSIIRVGGAVAGKKKTRADDVPSWAVGCIATEHATVR